MKKFRFYLIGCFSASLLVCSLAMATDLLLYEIDPPGLQIALDMSDFDIDPGLTTPAVDQKNILSLASLWNHTGFPDGSPETLQLTVADTAAFKLNKVPWQYKQE